MGLWGFGKKAVNSTIGTASMKPLDTILGTVSTSLTTIMGTILGVTQGGTQTFISNGTFIVPSNVKKIWITACAGGQGGWGYSYNSGRRGGQGGEWIIGRPYSVTPGQSISITVGTGGVFNYSDSISNQKPGGNTVIGSLLTLLGGGVSFNTLGGAGANGSDMSRDGYGSGGSGEGGGGGSLGRGSCNETKSSFNPGYGGGGYGSPSSSFGSWGNGGSGVVIIEW